MDWPFAKGNCLTAALYWRLRHGGRLRFEKATRWFGFHAYWQAPDGRCWEYVHPDALSDPGHRLPWHKVLRLWAYAGVVRRRICAP